MLTALHIEEKKSGFLRVLRRNRVKVEHYFCDSAAIKSVIYQHYRGKIGWGAIDRFVKAQRNRVLCSKALSLPAELGYKRYDSSELSRRMCENAALYLLRRIDGATAALVDSDGSCGGLCEELTDICGDLTVYTEDAEYYRRMEDRLLTEKGAALNIRKTPGCLSRADLIIAPARLETALPCSSNAVILSGERPAAAQPAPVIYDYYIELPAKLREIKPGYLDDMYFASALYSAAGVQELGSELFFRCGDGTTIHTRQSLSDMLARASGTKQSKSGE